MPGAGNLEINFLLTLEENLAVVQAPGEYHEANDLNQLLSVNAVIRRFSGGRAKTRDRQFHPFHSPSNLADRGEAPLIVTPPEGDVQSVTRPAYRGHYFQVTRAEPRCLVWMSQRFWQR